ncbi:hypothetical protein ElyMa_006107100, partial [Elysia marginata]
MHSIKSRTLLYAEQHELSLSAITDPGQTGVTQLYSERHNELNSRQQFAAGKPKRRRRC